MDGAASPDPAHSSPSRPFPPLAQILIAAPNGAQFTVVVPRGVPPYGQFAVVVPQPGAPVAGGGVEVLRGSFDGKCVQAPTATR